MAKSSELKSGTAVGKRVDREATLKYDPKQEGTALSSEQSTRDDAAAQGQKVVGATGPSPRAVTKRLDGNALQAQPSLKHPVASRGAGSASSSAELPNLLRNPYSFYTDGTREAVLEAIDVQVSAIPKTWGHTVLLTHLFSAAKEQVEFASETAADNEKITVQVAVRNGMATTQVNLRKVDLPRGVANYKQYEQMIAKQVEADRQHEADVEALNEAHGSAGQD